ERSGLPPGVVPAAVILGVITLFVIGVRTGVCDQHLSTWVRLTTTGLTLGSIYAMIALGYTMVYGVLQLLNFAHSEVFMIGSFADVMHRTNVFGIAGVQVQNLQLLVIAVAVIMLVILDRFVYRTQSGKGIRAVAEDPETASLMGVNITRIIVLTFAVGGFMAG